MIRDYYKRIGVEVVATITGDGRMDDIRRAHGAALNVVQCSGSMIHLAKAMEEKYGIPFRRVSYFGIEDMSGPLYDVAEFFGDAEIIAAARELVRDEVAAIMPELRRYRAGLEGRRAAVYTGGAFKAFSLVRSLRTLGMKTVLVGSQTGNNEDYELLRELCDEGTILVDDTNPLELSRFVQEKGVDLFIGGVKERPIAFKLGIGFCDHNHERKEALAGFEGMLNFAREVHRSVMSPVWKLVPRKRPAAAVDDPLLPSQERRHHDRPATLFPQLPSTEVAAAENGVTATPASSARRWGPAWPSAASRGPFPSCTARRAAPPTSAAT